MATNIFGYNMNQYDTIRYRKYIYIYICVCVIKSINYAHSDSKTKVLRRPPSLTEEGSMVLLLHMWPNDFPAARDLIRAAKSHPVPVVQICPPKKSILQNHQFISFMTIFLGAVVDTQHVAPIVLQEPVASNPQKDITRNGFRTPSDKLRKAHDDHWFCPAAVWFSPDFEWFCLCSTQVFGTKVPLFVDDLQFSGSGAKFPMFLWVSWSHLFLDRMSNGNW